jgi:competence protein ComEA
MMKSIQSLLLSCLIFFSVSAFAGSVNINTANPEMLTEGMTGIGDIKARAIVEYREKNGPFKSIDDLVYVKGIASGTVTKNRDNITIK